MAVGKGSINRVSKAAAKQVTEIKENAAAKCEEVKAEVAPAPAAKKPAARKPAAKKTTAKKSAAVVAKPSAQVEELLKKKDGHYGMGDNLPTYLM